MHKVLTDLLPDIDALYSDEVVSLVRKECHEVLRRRVGLGFGALDGATRGLGLSRCKNDVRIRTQEVFFL
jgi:hypothetical protein